MSSRSFALGLLFNGGLRNRAQFSDCGEATERKNGTLHRPDELERKMNSPLKTAFFIGLLMSLLQLFVGYLLGHFFLGLLIAISGGLWLGYQVYQTEKSYCSW